MKGFTDNKSVQRPWLLPSSSVFCFTMMATCLVLMTPTGVDAFGLPPPSNENAQHVGGRPTLRATPQKGSPSSSTSSATPSGVVRTTARSISEKVVPSIPKPKVAPPSPTTNEPEEKTQRSEKAQVVASPKQNQPEVVPDERLWDPSFAAFRTEDRFMTPSMVGYQYRQVIAPHPLSDYNPQPIDASRVADSSELTTPTSASRKDTASDMTAATTTTTTSSWNPSESQSTLMANDFMDSSMVGYRTRDVINYPPPTVPAKLDSVDRFFSPSMLNPMRRPVLGIYSDEGVGFERGGASLDGGYGWVGSPTHTSPYPPGRNSPQ